MLEVLVEDIWKYKACLIGFSGRYLNLKKIAMNFLKKNRIFNDSLNFYFVIYLSALENSRYHRFTWEDLNEFVTFLGHIFLGHMFWNAVTQLPRM